MAAVVIEGATHILVAEELLADDEIFVDYPGPGDLARCPSTAGSG
jgi:hypothetical protein